jgi:hypothetical protein
VEDLNLPMQREPHEVLRAFVDTEKASVNGASEDRFGEQKHTTKTNGQNGLNIVSCNML